jgi:putative photosynthetic complex assembly protein 2
MLELWLPVIFGIFIWWFATGLILLLDALPQKTFRWSLLISTLLALCALAGLAHTSNQVTVVGAYCAFTCALLVWGWHELTFLTGSLTGPRKKAFIPNRDGSGRFQQAVAAILWHELALVAIGLIIIAITWRAQNQVGTWTFLVLWIMRISAKLNLYFGVRNLSEEFLPAHLAYMGSYFLKRRMNLFLPIAVIMSSMVLALLLVRAFAPGTPLSATVGLLLVSTILSMAILEHVLLVLPLQSTALWKWALRNRKTQATIG